MVADGGRLPTASSPSGLRAFSSCHLPRCHGTSVLWATVHTLSVATPLLWPRPVGPWPPPTPGLSVGPGAGRAGGGVGGKLPVMPAVTTLALWKLLPHLTSSPLAAASTLALHPTSAPHLCLMPGMPNAEISDGGVHLAIGVGDTRLESWRPPGRALSARQDTFLPGWCQSPGGAGVWVPRRGPRLLSGEQMGRGRAGEQPVPLWTLLSPARGRDRPSAGKVRRGEGAG